jgi:5'-hydroxyaverantin dehydrogenase
MAASILPPGLEKLVPKLPPIDFSATPDTSSLKDKSVLITGGASGIGLACAEAFTSHGALVTIADLQQEAGDAAAKQLSSKGKAQFVQCNVTDYQSQFAAFKSAIEFGGGRLDVVVPCAGIIAQRNLVEMAASTEPSLDAPPPEPGFSTVDVNLKGVYYTSFLALHYFRLPGPVDEKPFKKAIVLVASLAGYLGFPFSTTYSLSKFGVRGLFYAIRDQARAADIRVNLIAPWYIKTAMTTVEEDDPLGGHLSMFGFAPMEEVVETVLRLSADEGVTGRSALIVPEGKYDIGDNIWDGFGGKVVQERMAERLGNVAVQMAAYQKQKEQQQEKL